MIYIIFTIVTVINIFNIILIANNNLTQQLKEKFLLSSYSLAEFIFILFIFNSIEFTATNLILALSVIIIWLLSKAYICILNMNFENVEEEGSINMDKNNNLDKNIEPIEMNIETDKGLQNTAAEESIANQVLANESEDVIETRNDGNVEAINDEIDETEIISEVEPEKLELSALVENSLNNQRNVKTHNSLYTLSDIVNATKSNEYEERRSRRRSLALKINKIEGDNN